MDESRCFFDITSSATFDLRGVKTVKVTTTENEKIQFSVVLTAGVRKDASSSTSTRTACQSNATPFDQNKRIFLSTLPRTRFNTEVCSYFSLL